MKKEDRPEWFRSIDKNNDDTIQLIEFDSDFAKVANFSELIRTLKSTNGVLAFDLGHN